MAGVNATMIAGSGLLPGQIAAWNQAWNQVPIYTQNTRGQQVTLSTNPNVQPLPFWTSLSPHLLTQESRQMLMTAHTYQNAALTQGLGSLHQGCFELSDRNAGEAFLTLAASGTIGLNYDVVPQIGIWGNVHQDNSVRVRINKNFYREVMRRSLIAGGFQNVDADYMPLVMGDITLDDWVESWLHQQGLNVPQPPAQQHMNMGSVVFPPAPARQAPGDNSCFTAARTLICGI